MHTVILELLGLGLQVALVLGGLADPGEADGEGKAVDHGRGSVRKVCAQMVEAGKDFVKGFRRAVVYLAEGCFPGNGGGCGKRPLSAGRRMSRRWMISLIWRIVPNHRQRFGVPR